MNETQTKTMSDFLVEKRRNEESFGANLKQTVKNKTEKGKRRGRRKIESILEFCFCILRPGPQIPKLKIQKQISKNICILYARPHPFQTGNGVD